MTENQPLSSEHPLPVEGEQEAGEEYARALIHQANITITQLRSSLGENAFVLNEQIPAKIGSIQFLTRRDLVLGMLISYNMQAEAEEGRFDMTIGAAMKCLEDIDTLSAATTRARNAQLKTADANEESSHCVLVDRILARFDELCGIETGLNNPIAIAGSRDSVPRKAIVREMLLEQARKSNEGLSISFEDIGACITRLKAFSGGIRIAAEEAGYNSAQE